MEAYKRLVAARTTERESFSRVICRAVWPAKAETASDLLLRMHDAKSHVISLNGTGIRENSRPKGPVSYQPRAQPWDLI